MRPLIFACALLAAPQLVGCGSSSSDGQSVDVHQPSRDRAGNPDLLGELFPLSTNFGVCTRRVGLWRAELRPVRLGSHFPTDGEITLAGGVKLTITVGKFGFLPGTVFQDVRPTSLPRRIQIAEWKGHVGEWKGEKSLVVSDFEGAGNNRVVINLDEADVDEAAAIAFANTVVSCHLSGRQP